jgi:hypothetical protein
MFPRLREQIGTALDLIVEFSTLGEYRLAVESPGASSAPVDAPSQAPQMGGASATALRAAVRRTVAGGAAGTTPVATPAARRLVEGAKPRTAGGEAAKPRAARDTAKALPVPHVSGCDSGRRRASDAAKLTPAKRTPARARVRQGAPVADEQLCLAV